MDASPVSVSANKLACALLVSLAICLFLFAPPAHAQAIVAGGDHTCAFTPAGGVVCWGANDTGELGDTTTTDRTTPNNVIGVPFNSTALAAGYSHSCAVTSLGAAMCWGSNANGQIGDGSIIQRLLPVGVSGLGAGVTRIVGGRSHTCALVSGGVQCWGKNNNGQLGTGTAPTADQPAPVGVSGLGSGVTAIAGGFNHNCAVTTSGAALCWGANFGAQLGNPIADVNFEPAPFQVAGLTSGIAAVAAGSDHSCALTTGGAVKCWGDNSAGAIGDGSGPILVESPADVTGLSSGVTAIVAGEFHTCALLTGGAVKCWGANSEGQVGDGSTTNRNTPVDVIVSGVTAIAAGAKFTCALFSAGTSSCWGSNANGQMGYGAVGGPSFVPVSTIYPTATTTSLASGLNPSVFGDNVTFTATVTGGVNGTPVAFQAGGVNIAGCTGQALASGTATCTTSVLGGGTQSMAAIYQGNAATLASTSAALSQVVNKADQTITFDALANKQDTDPPFTIGAIASSGLTVTFTSLTTLVCTVSGTTVTIVNPGTCSIAAAQGGNSNFNAATQVTQSFTVTSTGPGLSLTAVVSRKVHGAVGTFELPINPTLPITGLIDVEPRTIGTGHT
ncbi:MAG: Ig-like domain repeat protein, partial [Betaproteobacteria bacterium]